MSDAEVNAAFTQFYTRQATQEFAEDLDRVRRAEDFREGEGLEMLITALRQGAGLFSIEEMRRVVRAEREKEIVGAGD
jgi:ribosome assembly protein 3